MSTATMNLSETLELFKKYVVPNYVRYPVSLVRGEGSYVWDAEGNRYLDFFPGWGCNLLGHCPPAVVEAVQDQVATLIHVPNTWHTPWQGLVGPGIVGAQLRRPGVFLQLAAPRRTKRPSNSPACTRRRNATKSSPSPAAFTAARWRDDGHGAAEISRRLGPVGRRVYVRPVWRSGGGEETDRSTKPPPFSSSRSKAKGASIFRRPNFLPGCANCATKTNCS